MVVIVITINLILQETTLGEYSNVSAISTGPNNYTGRISSMLMPIPSQTMNTDSPMMDRSAAEQGAQGRMEAMRFSMAQDVSWLLSGDWNLLWNRSNTTGATAEISTIAPAFQAEFTKITTNGTMKHSHEISNFNVTSYTYPDPNVKKVSGIADVYFNNELAWPSSGLNATVLNDEVLRIDINSEDIDNHFHGQPIYGVMTR